MRWNYYLNVVLCFAFGAGSQVTTNKNQSRSNKTSIHPQFFLEPKRGEQLFQASPLQALGISGAMWTPGRNIAAVMHFKMKVDVASEDGTVRTCSTCD